MLKKMLATTALSALLASPALAQGVTQPQDPTTPTAPAPAEDPLGGPADDTFDAPADDAFDAPADDPLGAPADDTFDAPADDPLGAPADDAFDTQADDPLGAPADAPGVGTLDGEGAEVETGPGFAPEELIGADILDFDGQVVAQVNDVVTGADGEVETILINVGGFLGLGARTVGIPFEDVTVDTDDAGKIVLRTPLTSDDISDLPEFEQQV